MNCARIAIIGRPNVGKSTLFNALTHQRALVDDQPGVTRDRRCGFLHLDNGSFEFIDTAGFLDETDDDLQTLMNEQTELALEVADAVWLIVDAEQGPTELDRMLWQKIKQFNIQSLVLVNKQDRLTYQEESAHFFSINEDYILISSKNKAGFSHLFDWLEQYLHKYPQTPYVQEEVDSICILGRPNAGKSTLCNLLLGENRVIVSEHAGTTRDSIQMPVEIDGKRLNLIDTAGVRRKSRIKIKLEQQMIWQALGSLRKSAVTVIVVDSTAGLTDQDLKLMQHTWDSGSGMIICLNKWDLLDKLQQKTLLTFTENYTKQWPCPIIFSAFKTGLGLNVLKCNILKIIKAFNLTPNSTYLTKILNHAVTQTPPPLSSRKTPVKLRFAHPVGYKPLKIKITGKQVDHLPGSYKKYLSNQFTKALQSFGCPMQLILRQDKNPYDKTSV
ncbi:MAG: ribosome biogenesis GTPase Der [Gammaproteobacteria bacterium]|jgi:GTP-binding protein|nr:ribosome biogenesis GTPase Der [Gammaproteobacteria bacterium]